MLFLSRLHPKKNVPELLRAWADLPPGAHARWLLAIAGWAQDAHEADLKRFATELNLSWSDLRNDTQTMSAHGHPPIPSVLFLGPQFERRKAACYFHADAFCLPSLSEGLPLAILEAWAYGLPVIMTRECNLPEGFAANAAIAVSTAAVGIATGLRTLMALSDSARKAMGQRGRNLAATRFSWTQIAREMAAVYRWVLHGGPVPASVNISPPHA
jgi:poly(glycerol-phosphate) alpha-glucosyltransferase